MGERVTVFTGGMDMVMRQDFVLRISFYAELEVVSPDGGRHVVLHLAGRHVIIKFCAARDCVVQRGKKLAGPFDHFWNWINESLVIARLMSFDRRRDRRHDILRSTRFGQKDFDARAGRLRRFDEDEFVFMGQDHFSCSDGGPTIVHYL